MEINPQEEAATSALGEAIAQAIVAALATEPEIAQAEPIVRDSFRKEVLDFLEKSTEKLFKDLYEDSFHPYSGPKHSFNSESNHVRP